MFAISDGELGHGNHVEPGDRVHCSKCGQTHELQAAKDQAGNDSMLLLFYSCGPDSFLGAVQQQTLPGVHLVV